MGGSRERKMGFSIIRGNTICKKSPAGSGLTPSATICRPPLHRCRDAAPGSDFFFFSLSRGSASLAARSTTCLLSDVPERDSRIPRALPAKLSFVGLERGESYKNRPFKPRNFRGLFLNVLRFCIDNLYLFCYTNYSRLRHLP